MISERQKAFRQEYRSRIVGWYDGYVHILIIYAMGAAAFYIYVQHIHNVTWLGMADRAFDVLVHQYVRMGGAQIHYASASQYQRPACHLRTAHAQSSSVLHRPGNAISRQEGLARNGFSALCAGRVHPDVNSDCRGAWVASDA